MKSSVDYCGIYDQKYGDFKYPKLMELVKKCFYDPNDSIESTDVHSAKIDVHLTAKCFFKLIDIGIIKSKKDNFNLTTQVTSNSNSKRNSLENLLSFSVENLPDQSFHFAGVSPLFGNPDRYVKKMDHFELDIFDDIEIEVFKNADKNVILTKSIYDVSIEDVDSLLNLFVSIFGSDDNHKRELSKKEKAYIRERSNQFTRIWVVSGSRLVIFSFDGFSLIITLPF